LRAVAKQVPLEKVMLETDAPYLAPIPQRGERNEPAFLTHTAAVLAQIKGVPLEEVAQVTTATARQFFHLPE
jgi:TatD DNase family protein